MLTCCSPKCGTGAFSGHSKRRKPLSYNVAERRSRQMQCPYLQPKNCRKGACNIMTKKRMLQGKHNNPHVNHLSGRNSLYLLQPRSSGYGFHRKSHEYCEGQSWKRPSTAPYQDVLPTQTWCSGFITRSNRIGRRLCVKRKRIFSNKLFLPNVTCNMRSTSLHLLLPMFA